MIDKRGLKTFGCVTTSEQPRHRSQVYTSDRHSPGADGGLRECNVKPRPPPRRNVPPTTPLSTCHCSCLIHGWNSQLILEEKTKGVLRFQVTWIKTRKTVHFKWLFPCDLRFGESQRKCKMELWSPLITVPVWLSEIVRIRALAPTYRHILGTAGPLRVCLSSDFVIHFHTPIINKVELVSVQQSLLISSGREQVWTCRNIINLIMGTNVEYSSRICKVGELKLQVLNIAFVISNHQSHTHTQIRFVLERNRVATNISYHSHTLLIM